MVPKVKEMAEVRLKKREDANAAPAAAAADGGEVSDPNTVTLRPDGFLRKPEFEYHNYEDLRYHLKSVSR